MATTWIELKWGELFYCANIGNNHIDFHNDCDLLEICRYDNRLMLKFKSNEYNNTNQYAFENITIENIQIVSETESEPEAGSELTLDYIQRYWDESSDELLEVSFCEGKTIILKLLSNEAVLCVEAYN